MPTGNYFIYTYVIMSTDENHDIIKEFEEIINFLGKKGYTVDPLNTEDTQHQLVVNGEKTFDYNDENGEYVDRSIKIKMVLNINKTSAGTRKRIIKRKKTTRRKGKTRK